MRRFGATAALSLALLTGAACSGEPDRSGPTASSTSVVDAPSGAAAGPTDAPGAPDVGDCLEPLTGPLVEGHHLPEIVDCDDPHGGEIVTVVDVEAPAEDVYPFDLEGLDERAGECVGTADTPGALDRFVGFGPLELPAADIEATGVDAAYRVSGIEYAMYLAGPAAWSRGERWLACAAVLRNSRTSPSAYSGTLRDALATPGELAEQLSWCKVQSDERNSYQPVPCDQPHNYEQLATFDAGDADDPDPGDAALGGLSQRLCPTVSSLATGGRSDRLPDGLGLGWTYPLPEEWQRGDRTVRCYVVTSEGLSVGAVTAGTAGGEPS